MSVKSRTLVYAAVAVILAAVIIGAAVTYNSSFLSTSTQQSSIGYSSQTSQASMSSRSSQSTPQSQTSSSQGSSSSGVGASSQSTSAQTSSPSPSTSILGGSGTLNIYLTDAPPSRQTLKYLLVNVSSVELRYEGSIATTTSSTSSTSSSSSTSTTTTTSTSTSVTTSTTTSTATTPQNVYIFNVPPSLGKNVNLTSLQGKSLLLGATKMPAGNITSVVINITGAKAFYTDKASEQLRVVADGKLMIPIHFAVQANGSTDLTVDITPNLVHISQGGVLTPVIHVTAVERGSNNSTTTHTADVDESASTTTTSTTTTASTSS